MLLARTQEMIYLGALEPTLNCSALRAGADFFQKEVCLRDTSGANMVELATRFGALSGDKRCEI